MLIFTCISLCRQQDQVSLTRLVSEARKVQLLIQLFNKINCWFVQGMKVVCLSATILNGYLGIRLRQNNVLIAIFCAAMHVSIAFAYCGTFNKAYLLQELQKKLKLKLKASCGKLSPRADYVAKKESFKAANALSCPGLKVGPFHEMERQSSLIFIDFVERQIISLLVAF